MSRPAKRVAVVAVMSRVETWRCQWPTNRALAAPEALAVLVAEGTAGLEEAPVVEDAPVPDVFVAHPAAATVTIPAMAVTNLQTNPGLATETCAVI